MLNSVLVTGASGFLGKYLYEFLKSQYGKVDKLGRQLTDEVTFDFGGDAPLEISSHYDIVVHSAGRAHTVPKNKFEADSFYKINYDGTVRLLKSLENRPPSSFIFISTIAVYGLDIGSGITEDFELKAVEPYGDSKRLAEDYIVKWCEKFNCKYGILRLPLVVGSNPPGNLGAMIKGIKTGNYFRIGNGLARKSMVLAEDVAYILPKLAEVGGIYNLTDGHHPSFKELETVLSEKLNTRIKELPQFLARLIAYVGDGINMIVRKRVFPLDSRAFYKITSTLVLDDTKARKYLGWSPKSSLTFLENNIE